MDQVFIRGLEVDAVICAYCWGRDIRQQPQKNQILIADLVLDLDMGWDSRPAARSDELSLALDYAAVSQRLLEYVGNSSFERGETLAARLAALIIDEFGVPWLRLGINKPGAVTQASGGVGVIIERGERRA